MMRLAHTVGAEWDLARMTKEPTPSQDSELILLSDVLHLAHGIADPFICPRRVIHPCITTVSSARLPLLVGIFIWKIFVFVASVIANDIASLACFCYAL